MFGDDLENVQISQKLFQNAIEITRICNRKTRKETWKEMKQEKRHFCFVIFADMYTLSQGQAPAVLCTLSWTCTPSSYGEVRRWDDRASKALDFWLAAAPDPGVVGAT